MLSRVTNEMTVGEMRQLLAHDPLEFAEEEYDLLIQAKTASLLSGACEVGALRPPPPSGRRSGALVRRWAWRSRSWTIFSTMSATRASPGNPPGPTFGSTRSRCRSSRRSDDERGRPAAGEPT